MNGYVMCRSVVLCTSIHNLYRILAATDNQSATSAKLGQVTWSLGSNLLNHSSNNAAWFLPLKLVSVAKDNTQS